tara:strand:- start:198 stop:782 length:585 start_codon:yes stop_codon:yes gene_type:complete
MKRLFLYIFLGLLLCNNSFAASKGKGEVKLSDSTVRHFKDYLSGKLVKGERWTPMFFVLSSDGFFSHYYYCPYSYCRDSGVRESITWCEGKSGVTCAVFARRRSVVWDNGTNMPRKEKRFNSKWDLEKVKSQLEKLGFYGGTSTTKPKITKKTTTASSDNSSDVVTQLKELKKLFNDGILTQEEFDKAKKKLLN